MKLAEHPTVRRFHERNGKQHETAEPKKLDAAWRIKGSPRMLVAFGKCFPS